MSKTDAINQNDKIVTWMWKIFPKMHSKKNEIFLDSHSRWWIIIDKGSTTCTLLKIAKEIHQGSVDLCCPNIGDRCWRNVGRNLLVTTLRFWWRFWPFLSPTSTFTLASGINIQKMWPTSKFSHHHPQIVINLKAPKSQCHQNHCHCPYSTVMGVWLFLGFIFLILIGTTNIYLVFYHIGGQVPYRK